MEDAVKAREVELVLGQVEATDVAATRVFLLQRRVVVVGEAVDADDVVAACDERLDEMRPDEPGRAGDGIAHPGRVLPARKRIAGQPPTSPARSRTLVVSITSSRRSSSGSSPRCTVPPCVVTARPYPA